MKRRHIFSIVTFLFCATTEVAYSRGVASEIKTKIVRQMLRDGQIHADCIKEEGPVKIVDISMVELNKDGKPEFLVIGQGCACQGARRCLHWIYREKQSGFEMIFGPDPADNITIQRNSRKGYFNIMSMGVSGDDVCTMTYKFDGRRYREDMSSFRCEPFAD